MTNLENGTAITPEFLTSIWHYDTQGNSPAYVVLSPASPTAWTVSYRPSSPEELGEARVAGRIEAKVGILPDGEQVTDGDVPEFAFLGQPENRLRARLASYMVARHLLAATES